MNVRGQSSIEVLLITSFVLVGVLIGIGAFTNLQDPTTALAYAKLGALSGLQRLDAFHSIERIDYVLQPGNGIAVNVQFNPPLDNPSETSAFNDIAAQTINQIEEHTSFNTASVVFK